MIDVGQPEENCFIENAWCGKGMTILLDKQGRIFMFGIQYGYTPTFCSLELVLNFVYDLRIGPSSDAPTPKLVKFPDGVRIQTAACGGDFAVAVSTEGSFYSLYDSQKNKTLTCVSLGIRTNLLMGPRIRRPTWPWQ